MRISTRLLYVFAIIFSIHQGGITKLNAQTSFQTQSSTKRIEAIKVSDKDEIKIDGLLDEPVWQKAPIATDFIQSTPIDGVSASEKTEVRVLYSNKYLYVGFMAYDSSPDSITASLFRRDSDEASDWVYVNIDSYNDDRTAFTFAANPLGVQKDIMYYDDTQEDVLWDAVWEVESRIVENGWMAEFKIPLSQLRFTSSNSIQNWGINFQRRIARRAEISFWSRTPRQEYGVVSRFGELTGVQDLPKPLRLEVTPYVSTELTNNQTDPGGNPFFEKNKPGLKLGGDIKYGITSDFTLTATINPDFGQVEADPATFNLSEFENYFEERRPFFLEGSEIFNFGGTTSQNSFRSHYNFYSRRIGKTPFALEKRIHSVTDNATGNTISLDYMSRNPVTTIAGAAKVSGKTKKGLSVGILDSYTVEETVSYFDSGNLKEGKIEIEPATNYLVGRVRQDLSKTDAQIGGFFSSVNRMLNGSYLEDYMHKNAYQVGVDAQYYWDARNWGASGVFAVSRVEGTAQAISRTQQTSAHYFNRSDSKTLSVDEEATSLTGYFGEFSIGKYSGTGLRYSFTYSEMSPGYEINDIGFLERADYRAPHFYLEYLNVQTQRVQFYLLWTDASYAWNFDGDMIFNYYSSGVYLRMNNLWTVLGIVGITGRFYNDRITRGGPTMLRPKDWNTHISITTNSAKNVYGNLTTSYRRDASGEYEIQISTAINYRPTTYIQLKLNPVYLNSLDHDQYQGFWGVDEWNNPQILFSDLKLNLFYTELRANITFTPKISFQTYLRPYYYTADFSDYKTFSESKTYNFTPIDPTTNEYYDKNWDLDNKTLQGNAVVRWEYAPGSTIFLVWQQSRNAYAYGQAEFEPYFGLLDTFKNKPINIFLLKWSYWFGS